MNQKLGDCYQVAGHMIMDNSNFVLCHGMVSGQGKLKRRRMGHAWIEHGDVIFDFSNNRKIIMRKEKYYKIGKIKKVKKYTQKQACKMMLKHKTFGDWS